MWRNKLCHTSPNTWDLYSGNQLVKIPLEVSCLPCPGWIGRCVFGKMLFFFWLLGIPQMYPTNSETQLKKCLILEGSGMVPSRAAGENVRALWLPRVRCGKKGGSMWLPFCASNPSAKLFFACGQATVDRLRHEDLLLATRVPPRTSQAQRTHQMAHMMWPNS